MIQITIDNWPRLQKLQNMFKLKVIMKTANEAMGEILDEKDLNIIELNHRIYAAATVITEAVYRSQNTKLWEREEDMAMDKGEIGTDPGHNSRPNSGLWPTCPQYIILPLRRNRATSWMLATLITCRMNTPPTTTLQDYIDILKRSR